MICIDKKPKIIWICGHEVSVKYRKKLAADGFFHPDRDEIEIRNCEIWKDILLHEIIHGILYYSGQAEKFEEKEEESLVMALENGLKTLIFH